MRKSIILFLVSLFIFPSAALAGVGVGVAIGKIEVDQPVKPGGVYDLQPIVILNTGDEPGDYETVITYHSKQPEIQPGKDWFTFDPPQFHLEPGQVQTVGVKLIMPIKALPGDYFAYLQGQPVKKIDAGGGASIGVAAATKLYFKAIPASIWQGMYYRFVSVYARYHPWDTIVLSVLFVVILLRIIGRYFNFQIQRKGTPKKRKPASKKKK